MTTNFRLVQRGQASNKLILSFRNIDKIAELVQASALTSRRAFVNKIVIARVLNAMAMRRIQQTNMTAYAQQYDRVVNSAIGVVPEVMCALLSGIPINGFMSIGGEVVPVGMYDNDANEITAYVQGPQFLDDLMKIKSFGEAQGVALVQIDPFRKFIQPSIHMTVLADSGEDTSIIVETQALTEEVTYLQYVSEGRTRVTIKDAPDTAKSATGVQTDFTEGGFMEAVDVSETVVVEPIYTRARLEDVRLQTPGTDDTVTTVGKAAGVLFPIIHKVDILDQPCFSNLLFSTRTSVAVDNQADREQILTQGYTVLQSSMAIEQAKESSAKGIEGQARKQRYNADQPWNGADDRVPANPAKEAKDRYDDANQGRGNPGYDRPPARDSKNGGRGRGSNGGGNGRNKNGNGAIAYMRGYRDGFLRRQSHTNL